MKKLLPIVATIICVVVHSTSADKIREKVPENSRGFVETQQNAYMYNWLRYLMYVPKEYANSAKDYPLILYFHGAGQKGTDATDLTYCCLNKQLEGDKRGDFPFIVVSPQLPGPKGFSIPYSLDRGKWYNTDFLKYCNKLLDHIIERYAVDSNRIYCVGASMGGYATWKMSIMYPDRFAAIAPLCGEGDPDNVCAIKDVPVWVYHCEEDEVMPVGNSDKMVKALKDCGGDVTYVRPDGGDHHQCWSNRFNQLYDWLLTHEK